jgi:tetratricopeptide (TPR) repeat protein
LQALRTLYNERARPSGAGLVPWLALAVVLSWPDPALAGDATAEAQTLFEQGRDLLRSGNAAEACPRLEESQRLDPANGTLLALAMCHEAQGRLASASAEFAQVARLAERDGQVERAAWATERLAALKPLLSQLDVRIPQPVRRLPELQVRLNRATLHDDAWDTPIPVDGGEYRISVSATGYRSWEHVVQLAPQRANHVVVVPMLVREDRKPSDNSSKPSDAPPIAAHLDAANSAPRARTDELTSVQWLGITSAGFGLAGWLLGAGTMYRALDKYDSANDCADDCRHQRQTDARSLGDWATGFGVGGTALLLAGGAMYLWGGPSETSAPPTVSVDVGTQRAGVLVFSEF